MYAVRERLIRRHRLLLVMVGVLASGLILALYALTAQGSAAHPAKAGDAVTLSFTVTVQAGTPPSDVLFWVCPDAQQDGTGCDEMDTQPDGTFTFQLATTTGTTYQHIIIEWSHGRLPTSNGPIPAPPAHIACDYHPVTVTGPNSFTCKADFTPATVTPTPVTPTASPASTSTGDPGSTPGSSDNSTLITGLQIVIGVGLVLFFVLLAILIWQKMTLRRR